MSEKAKALDTGIVWDDMIADQRSVYMAEFNKDLPRTTEEWLAHAASLSAIEYDQQRETIAKRLEIRVATFDSEVEKRRLKEAIDKTGGRIVLLSDPEAWPSPIDGAELLDALLALLERFVILPAGAAVAIALWVRHTYLLDAAEVSPILAVTSSEKEKAACSVAAVEDLADTYYVCIIDMCWDREEEDYLWEKLCGALGIDFDSLLESDDDAED